METIEERAEESVTIKSLDDYGPDIAAACNKIADDLLKEHEVAEPQWISVDDRLPEGNVLVIDAYGEINVAFYDDSIEEFWLSCDGTAVIIADVTHWMPLPEPPKTKQL